MVPIIKLFEVVKPHIAANQEAKTLFSDIITMMGQVQYNLSLRRRFMIKPHLKKKYHNLCHISMPTSNKLFGDDVSKEVKNSDTGISIAKDGYNSNYYRPYRGRGMFPNRGNYRGSGMFYAVKFHANGFIKFYHFLVIILVFLVTCQRK